MDPVLPPQPLQPQCDVDDFLGVGVGLVHGPQLRRGPVPLLVALGLGEAGPQGRVAPHHQGRHQLGDLVPHDVRLAQHARRIAHGGPRLDRRERDHLGHPVAAVLLGCVAHHIAPVALVEVHVDVGHLLAARVEEALEEQVVLDRVEVDDAQAVRHAAPRRRASPGSHPYPPIAGELDQIPHHEEVGGEAHVVDDPELEVQALHHRRRQRRPVPLPGPVQRELAQVGGRPLLVGLATEFVGHGKLRQGRLAQLQLHIGALGNEQRVVARFRQLGEEVAHLARRLEIVLGALELEAVGVGEQGAGLHAQQRTVGGRMFAQRVVTVVGGQQRRIEVSGDLDQLRNGAVLVGDAVVLQLHEEVVGPENVLQPSGQPLGLRRVPRQQRLQDDSAQASGGGDQPLVVAFEQFPVDPWLVVVPLQEGGRGELEQVAVPRNGLRQQGEVVVELPALGVPTGVVHLAPAHRTLVAGLPRHVGLGPDDGRDPLLTAGLVEVEDPVHVAVVGDAQRRLAVRRGGSHQLFDPGRSVQHGELGVGVKMRKRPPRHRPSFQQ